MFDLTLSGLRQAKRTFDRIAGRPFEQIVIEAIWQSAIVIRDEARRQAPEDDGDLARSIKRRRLKKKSGELAAIAIRAGTAYANAVAGGTKERTKRSGASTGRIEANPFFQAAVRVAGDLFLKTLVDLLAREVVRLARR
ncbi:hypothetical protein Pan216_30360 [Planctomycetes bacterium Pan216]|uniref:Phage protein, HK97 gp10 family n=1 Tax=Kolteria novifilia TaxID=2527975 RepID=A0A518B5C3_9BACT|nr:hypothetical protein Pan216_30360 [Planctomycetes bacterium Pan216]